MKKLLILILAVIPAFELVGCNGKNAAKRQVKRGAYVDEVGSGEERKVRRRVPVDEVGSGEEEQLIDEVGSGEEEQLIDEVGSGEEEQLLGR